MRLLGLGRSGAQPRLLARFGRNGVRGQGTSRDLRPLLSSRRYQSGFAAILQPVALTSNVDRRRVMQQPVQYRRGDDRIPEDRSPISVALVRGQEDAPAFVPRAHQLKEYRRSQIVQRQIPHFVDHQNFRRQVYAHPAVQPPLAIRSTQVRRQIVRGNEIRAQSRADRLLRQRHAQMRFPNARRPQQNDVASFVNKSQRTQLPNLPFIQRWLKTEIELLEGFYEGKMRQLQPRPQITSPSRFHLAT